MKSGITKTLPLSRSQQEIDALYDGSLNTFEFHMAGKPSKLEVGDYVYTIYKNELIGRLQIQAGTALDGVRRLARGLHPLALEQLGFVPAVEQYVDEFMSSCGVKTNVHARSISKSLSGAVATALYRIIQEALTNAARHGGATEVNLVIDCIDDEINLVIEDDGHGMPEQGDRERGKPEGLGLQGIRERAFLLGGTLTIERNQHGGTTLRIKIPTDAGGNGLVVTDPLEDRFAAHS